MRKERETKMERGGLQKQLMLDMGLEITTFHLR